MRFERKQARQASERQPHAVSACVDPHIGRRVRSARKACGLSQQEVAQLAQMSRTSLVQFERGEQSVSVERLRTLALVLSVSSDYLLGLTTHHSEPGGPLAEYDRTDPPTPAPRRRRTVAP